MTTFLRAQPEGRLAQRVSPIVLSVCVAAATFGGCGDDQSGSNDPTGGAGGDAVGGSTGGSGGAPGGSGGAGGTGGEPCLADVSTDPANCGACGHLCLPNQTCQQGTCVCDDNIDAVSFQNDILPILQNCTNALCHGGFSGGAQLELAFDPYAEIVGVDAFSCTDDDRLRVDPGAPDVSYVINKLTGSELCNGTPMPPMQPLPDDQIRKIADWICLGAPNN